MELNERELYIKTLRNLEHFEMEANINDPRLYRMTEIFFSQNMLYPEHVKVTFFLKLFYVCRMF